MEYYVEAYRYNGSGEVEFLYQETYTSEDEALEQYELVKAKYSHEAHTEVWDENGFILDYTELTFG